MKKWIFGFAFIAMVLLGMWLGSLANSGEKIKTEEDNRSKKIHSFLKKYAPSSPFIGHEQYIVDQSDIYMLPYWLYIAISGVESSYGTNGSLLIKNNNFTSIDNGHRRFKSVRDNINFTLWLISTSDYYKKFRKTGEIGDLAKVYKGVPPYEEYILTILWISKEIDRAKI